MTVMVMVTFMFLEVAAGGLRGLRATWAATERTVLARLAASHPRLRLVMVVRDPLSQLDSMVSHGMAFYSPLGQATELSLPRSLRKCSYHGDLH